jgi:hypothetical protein
MRPANVTSIDRFDPTADQGNPIPGTTMPRMLDVLTGGEWSREKAERMAHQKEVRQRIIEWHRKREERHNGQAVE